MYQTTKIFPILWRADIERKKKRSKWVQNSRRTVNRRCQSWTFSFHWLTNDLKVRSGRESTTASAVFLVSAILGNLGIHGDHSQWQSTAPMDSILFVVSKYCTTQLCTSCSEERFLPSNKCRSCKAQPVIINQLLHFRYVMVLLGIAVFRILLLLECQ